MFVCYFFIDFFNMPVFTYAVDIHIKSENQTIYLVILFKLKFIFTAVFPFDLLSQTSSSSLKIKGNYNYLYMFYG